MRNVDVLRWLLLLEFRMNIFEECLSLGDCQLRSFLLLDAMWKSFDDACMPVQASTWPILTIDSTALWSQSPM